MVPFPVHSNAAVEQQCYTNLVQVLRLQWWFFCSRSPIAGFQGCTERMG